LKIDKKKNIKNYILIARIHNIIIQYKYTKHIIYDFFKIIMRGDETPKTTEMSQKLNEYNYFKFRRCQINKNNNPEKIYSLRCVHRKFDR